MFDVIWDPIQRAQNSLLQAVDGFYEIWVGSLLQVLGGDSKQA